MRRRWRLAPLRTQNVHKKAREAAEGSPHSGQCLDVETFASPPFLAFMQPHDIGCGVEHEHAMRDHVAGAAVGEGSFEGFLAELVDLCRLIGFGERGQKQVFTGLETAP